MNNKDLEGSVGKDPIGGVGIWTRHPPTGSISVDAAPSAIFDHL